MRQPQVVFRAQAHEHRPFLGDQPHPPAGPHVQRSGDRSPPLLDGAAQRADLASERKHRGRLPRTVSSQQRQHLPRPQLDAHVLDHGPAVIPGRHAAGGKDQVPGGGPHPRGPARTHWPHYDSAFRLPATLVNPLWMETGLSSLICQNVSP